MRVCVNHYDVGILGGGRIWNDILKSLVFPMSRFFVLFLVMTFTACRQQELKAGNGKADIAMQSAGETCIQGCTSPVRVWFADDELSKLTEYDVFTASTSEPREKILFSVTTEVEDFKVLALSDCQIDDNGKISFHEETLYVLPQLTPKHPVVVIMTFWGSIPNNGISYKDSCGKTHKLTVGISGMDGSVEINEY